MKKLILILLCSIAFTISCKKIEVQPDPPPKIEDIFSLKEKSISNGESFNFILESEGVYTLTLFDSLGQQVVTRERIIGKIGENSLKLYTKSLPVKYLYLSLEDVNRIQIGKTLLIIN
jgi:hypothetical protein